MGGRFADPARGSLSQGRIVFSETTASIDTRDNLAGHGLRRFQLHGLITCRSTEICRGWPAVTPKISQIVIHQGQRETRSILVVKRRDR